MGEGDKIYEKYLKLQEKYNLPDYHSINKEFEISNLDSNKFMLRQIRKKIHSKLDDYCEIIEDLLQPSATISQMHEYRFFSETAKKRIYDLYRKLMHMSRTATELTIHNDKEKDIEFIREFFSSFDSIKKEMVSITSTMKKSWKEELDKDIKFEYFG
ncbi:MAG: hypothetical protein ACLFPQ_02470 [Candidatus Woesearchaeota archaeon]